jgi:hypothetical protein
VLPDKMAYDRPSEKLIGFLAKHFGLRRYAAQANNFVVFKQYWDESVSDSNLLKSISQRPLTKSRRVSGVNRAALSGVSADEPSSREPKLVDTSPTYSPSRGGYPSESLKYPDEPFDHQQNTREESAYRIVTLPYTPSKVPGQGASSFDNLFPSQSQQPPAEQPYKSNLSPLAYKRRDIAEPPNRTTPTKLAAESRGVSITSTQRFKHSPVG